MKEICRLSFSEAWMEKFPSLLVIVPALEPITFTVAPMTGSPVSSNTWPVTFPLCANALGIAMTKAAVVNVLVNIFFCIIFIFLMHE